MGEEGYCDDFQSAFICLPAPKLQALSSLTFDHMNPHVIVVVAGTDTSQYGRD